MRKFASIQDAAKSYVDALAATVASNASAIAANAQAIAALVALGKPVRYDGAQSLTQGMIAQVLANLGVTYVLSSAGYINLFRLLIFQWGSVTTGSNGSATWPFPTTFPNGVFAVLGTPAGGAGAGVAIPNAQRSNSSVVVNAATVGGGNYTGPLNMFAIGY